MSHPPKNPPHEKRVVATRWRLMLAPPKPVIRWILPEFEIDCECMARRGKVRRPDDIDAPMYHDATH
jgi:hypothetical protein